VASDPEPQDAFRQSNPYGPMVDAHARGTKSPNFLEMYRRMLGIGFQELKGLSAEVWIYGRRERQQVQKSGDAL
jgi:hypothetical protein